MNSIKDKILRRIKGKRRGAVFCARDFCDLTSRNSVDKNLSRLLSDGVIVKIDWGIYHYPVVDKDFGDMPPNMDDIALTIGRSLGVKIFPSGFYCANRLGLINQVPAKYSYLTTGKSFTRKIGNYVVKFTHTSIDFRSNTPNKIMYIVNALSFMYNGGIRGSILRKCSKLLSPLDKKHLLKISNQLPAKMVRVIHQLNDT